MAMAYQMIVTQTTITMVMTTTMTHFPLDPTEWVDHDGDGTGDNADTDDDNDGVLDPDDQDPLNPFICSDVDMDALDDCSSGTFDPSNDDRF